MQQQDTYWDKQIFGVELFKLRYHLKRFLYQFFRVKLPKLKDQKDYWNIRGHSYMDEIINTGFGDRELFFQNMLIDTMKQLDFKSCFEAGCGFGWNIRRTYKEFPDVMVGGLDFSMTQLLNSKIYLETTNIHAVNGDNCCMPFKENAFDIGFSMGVFMNVHPRKIRMAIQEMIRVCGKYIIHIEYDENNTTTELREKRAFKTNIISHDYEKLYKEFGMKIDSFLTYKDFKKSYENDETILKRDVEKWEGFEGPEKYILIVVEVS